MTETVSSIIWDVGKLSICQRTAHKARCLLPGVCGRQGRTGRDEETGPRARVPWGSWHNVAVGDVFTDVTHVYPDLIVHLTLYNARKAEGALQREGTTTCAE